MVYVVKPTVVLSMITSTPVATPSLVTMRSATSATVPITGITVRVSTPLVSQHRTPLGSRHGGVTSASGYVTREKE